MLSSSAVFAAEDEASSPPRAWTDRALGVHVAAPGDGWVLERPPPGSTRVRAMFVKRVSGAPESLLVISGDLEPNPRDVAQYAKAAFATLTADPLGFKIQEKGPYVHEAIGKGFRISYRSKDGLKRFEQVYLPAARGSILILTLQAPASVFESAQREFETALASLAKPE